jgi:hypothetical protein
MTGLRRFTTNIFGFGGAAGGAAGAAAGDSGYVRVIAQQYNSDAAREAFVLTENALQIWVLFAQQPHQVSSSCCNNNKKKQ